MQYRANQTRISMFCSGASVQYYSVFGVRFDVQVFDRMNSDVYWFGFTQSETRPLAPVISTLVNTLLVIDRQLYLQQHIP